MSHPSIERARATIRRINSKAAFENARRALAQVTARQRADHLEQTKLVYKTTWTPTAEERQRVVQRHERAMAKARAILAAPTRRSMQRCFTACARRSRAKRVALCAECAARRRRAALLLEALKRTVGRVNCRAYDPRVVLTVADIKVNICARKNLK
jgi:hypothetical protein